MPLTILYILLIKAGATAYDFKDSYFQIFTMMCIDFINYGLFYYFMIK